MSIMGTTPPAGLAPPVACLVRDLMFVGKITATAAAIGVAVRILRDPAALADVDAPRLVVDLNQAGALAAAVAWRTRTGRPVLGFVAHVDTDVIAEARAAGIDRVLARSAFTARLAELLGEA
jgi:AmiR/NasT family two-component response regulator